MNRGMVKILKLSFELDNGSSVSLTRREALRLGYGDVLEMLEETEAIWYESRKAKLD